MKKYVFILLIMTLCKLIYSLDLSTQNKIHETENFVYYAEDKKDYSELIELVETKNTYFQNIFKKSFSKKIEIYIYNNLLSFSKYVFNSDEPVMEMNGVAQPWSLRFFITSFYDTCKPKETLLKTPIHELVHLYFPSECLWIREGIAVYYADMLKSLPIRELPNSFSEITFYSKGIDETGKAYNCSGWMVKFIIEELLHNDIHRFRTFSKNPTSYKLIGYEDEKEFFKSWIRYMSK